MTRFLMSLDDSVELVKHAFFNARPGDLFVKKADACTVETLAMAVAQVMGVEPRIRRIGIRHGEKMYETLLAREESMQAIDQGDYFRVPLDARSLDYSVYVEQGEPEPRMTEFDSNNARRLNVGEAAQLISSLPDLQSLIGNVA